MTPSKCTCATLYVIVHAATGPRYPLEGGCEFISSAPLKPPLLASIKSTNYLINALCAMDAEGGGGSLGIQVDSTGKLMEGSIANIAIVDACGVLRTPR